MRKEEVKKLVLMIMVCLVFGGVSEVGRAGEKPSGKVLVQLYAFEAEVSQGDFEPFERQPGEAPNLSVIICLPLEVIFIGPYVQGFTFKWDLPLEVKEPSGKIRSFQPVEFIFQEGEDLFIWLVHSPGKGQNDVIACWTLSCLEEFIELTTPGGTSLNIEARILPGVGRGEGSRVRLAKAAPLLGLLWLRSE